MPSLPAVPPAAAVTTTPPLPPNFSVHLYRSTPTTLPALPPALLASMTACINAAYLHSDRLIKPPLFAPDKQRLDERRTVEADLGEHGILAIITDDSNDGQVVATAGLKRWDGGREQGGKIRVAGSPGPNAWEVRLVAVRPDERLRGKGLASAAISLLEQEALRLAKAKAGEAQTNGTADETIGARASPEVTFWLHVLRESNGPYWTRRGYQVVDSQWLESAWTSLRALEIDIMRKVVY